MNTNNETWNGIVMSETIKQLKLSQEDQLMTLLKSHLFQNAGEGDEELEILLLDNQVILRRRKTMNEAGDYVIEKSKDLHDHFLGDKLDQSAEKVCKEKPPQCMRSCCLRNEIAFTRGILPIRNWRVNYEWGIIGAGGLLGNSQRV